MDPVFRSKVDLWLVALVVGILIVLLQFFFQGSQVSGRGEDILAVVIVIIVLALFAWVYATTSYTIGPENLFVKSGPFHWVIPIGDITRIESTRSPASNPALSLDRLLIHYGAGEELMVSPADKGRFMMVLRNRMKEHSDARAR